MLSANKGQYTTFEITNKYPKAKEIRPFNSDVKSFTSNFRTMKVKIKFENSLSISHDIIENTSNFYSFTFSNQLIQALANFGKARS